MPIFQIQFRRDTTANWESCNPVLLLGELGLEFKEDGTRLFKIGDGNTAWTDLPYCSGPKGDKFEFSDFTPEQLEMLKGPKGDAFVYSDFTPAQLEALVGPKGEDGAAPEHKWEGTTLQFQNADGSWGHAVDLKGPKGDTTVSALPIATDSVLGGIKVGDGLSATADGALTVNKATEAPLAAGTASVGSSNKFALEDHSHPAQSVPAAATATPLAPGTAAVGTSTKYAREDHRHPKQEVSAGEPTGFVKYFARKDVPDGYLVCNGGSYSSTTYKALYDVIGTTFGGTSSSFKVPNLIDKVVWGSATVGTSKSAGLPNITGLSVMSGASVTSESGALGKGSSTLTYPYGEAGASGYPLKLDASRSNSIYGSSTTVQPPALTLLPCIKY